MFYFKNNFLQNILLFGENSNLCKLKKDFKLIAKAV